MTPGKKNMTMHDQIQQTWRMQPIQQDFTENREGDPSGASSTAAQRQHPGPRRPGNDRNDRNDPNGSCDISIKYGDLNEYIYVLQQLYIYSLVYINII